MDSLKAGGRQIWPIIESRGRATPQSVAVHCRDIEVTYGELLDRAGQLALRLDERWSGQIGGLLINDPLERLIAMLAVLRLGRGYWIAPDGMSPDLIVEHCGTLDCSFLLADSALESIGVFVRAGISVLESTGERAEVRFAVSRGDEAERAGSDAAVAAVYFTSGSTGKPKMIRRTQAQIIARAELYSAECEFSHADRFALMTHPAFVAAEGDIYGCLLRGGALYLVDPNELGLEEFSHWVQRNKISVIHPPAPYFQKWVATWRADELFPHLRCVLLGGGGVPAVLIQGIWKHLAPNALVHHRYSSTEAGPVARLVLRERDAIAAGTHLPIGTPFSFVDWKLNSEKGDPACEGELLVKSPSLSEDAPRDAQGFYHTGDWVRAANDGKLTFLGRRDGIVKVRGFRVHLDGLSHTLAKQPGITDARVVAWNRDSQQTQLIGFVVTAASGHSGEAISKSLKKALPRWQVPSQIVKLEQIPETPTGKHDVPQLLRYLESRHPVECQNHAADVEQQLENLWRAESRWVGPIDRNRVLLEHGGESLMVLGFLARIEKSFAVRLTQLDFVRRPSVNQLAEYLRTQSLAVDARQGSSPRIAPINQPGYPPIVCLAWAGEPTTGDIAIGKELERQRTLYWLYPPGLDGQATPLRTIEEQVDNYCDVIRGQFGDQPLVLCGFSLGGIAAYALATSGKLNVQQLILIDTQLAARRDFHKSAAGPMRRWLQRRKLDLRILRFRLIGWRACRRGTPFPVKYRNRYFRHLNRKARLLFDPVPYTGSVNFIGSNGFEGEGLEARVRPWRELCRNLTMSYVDTDHVGLFRYPHLRQTARLIVNSAAQSDVVVRGSAIELRDAA